MDHTYKWAQANTQQIHLISIEEHLLALEHSRKKNDDERRLLENECRQKLRELENVIGTLSKEVNSLKSCLGQDSCPVVLSSSDLWLWSESKMPVDKILIEQNFVILQTTSNGPS